MPDGAKVFYPPGVDRSRDDEKRPDEKATRVSRQTAPAGTQDHPVGTYVRDIHVARNMYHTSLDDLHDLDDLIVEPNAPPWLPARSGNMMTLRTSVANDPNNCQTSQVNPKQIYLPA
jgi:hypothetical protein